MSNVRFDNVGMWWEDYEPPKSARGSNDRRARTVPVPDTKWTPPRDFPNLANVKRIGFDTETRDENLIERGPGFLRKDAHVVGVTVATTDAAWYFPIRHEYESQRSLNMDPAKVFAFVDDVFSRDISIVGANLMYDLEAMRAEGVRHPRGVLHDVQFAEPLIDEEARSYALETLGRKYLGEGKTSSQLYDWCAASFGGEANGKQRKNLWRSPPTLVGPYAESDGILPLRILAKQARVLQDEELWELYKLECRLIPLLLDMRFRGVRVDVAKAEQVLAWLRAEARKAQDEIPHVDVWAPESLEAAFTKAGVELARTEAGNPSFRKEWLEACPHPLAKAILRVRMYEKAANPFVESYLLGNQIDGRVHCQFNPLRSDDYGTVSGRFSSSNPNLQNIPSRDKVLGPMLRGLFIPEEGCLWRRGDYSQIEYRMLAHYAVGKSPTEKASAAMIRRRFRDDPKTDFHEMTQDIVLAETSITLDRKPAKNLNFGLVYGMAEEKTTRSLGVSAELGKRLYDAYHEAMPCVRYTYKSAERLAKRRGFIRTILGRRRRYARKDAAFFTALNACLQGSAADVMKKAMVDCYEAGLFAEDACGIPHLTVHDELDWSEQRTERAQKAFIECERVMTTGIEHIKVPLMVEMSTGANWGDCA